MAKAQEDHRSRPVTLSEVKDLLVKEQGARQELTYEQKLALDHADHFVKLTPEKSRELVAGLVALGGRMTDYYAHRFADLLPTHGDDVKAVFARERSTPDDAEIEKILAIVRDYI
jgi:DNA-directed RNA polymerase subunit F